MSEKVIIDLIFIFVLHFIGDFVLQSDYMAKNKSKSELVLSYHGLIYSIPFLFVFGVNFMWINFILHVLIDFWTSRASGYYYSKNKIHNFFMVIGFDQMLHMICLVLTLYFMRYY